MAVAAAAVAVTLCLAEQPRSRRQVPTADHPAVAMAAVATAAVAESTADTENRELLVDMEVAAAERRTATMSIWAVEEEVEAVAAAAAQEDMVPLAMAAMVVMAE